MSLEDDSTNPSIERSSDEMVRAVAEYLFDLFDANLTEDFQIMDQFETSACTAFASYEPGDEFTVEQFELHRRFEALFERLTEGFLRISIGDEDQMLKLSETVEQWLKTE